MVPLFFAWLMVSATSGEDVGCKEMPKELLGKILGPAFNPRYMSIDPPEAISKEAPESDRKRDSLSIPSFYIDQGFVQELSPEPAWNVDHIQVGLRSKMRRKRQEPNSLAWQCKSKVHWTDLGLDYFPRYMRSVECLEGKCWYNRFECQPRSFTVKVLRRKRGNCTLISPGVKVGTLGLPTDLRELWIWEERALNFCCDCFSDYKQLLQRN